MDPQPQQRKIGCGCIAAIVAAVSLVVLLLCGGFVVGILTFVFGMIKSSQPYSEAITKARASPVVVEALGEPVETGFFVSGNIEITGSSGHADLAIPISGPNGSGTIYVVAEKSGGEWTYRTLAVAINDADRVNLLDEKTDGTDP